jgi:rhodanese-related sulfurtransferase
MKRPSNCNFLCPVLLLLGLLWSCGESQTEIAHNTGLQHLPVDEVYQIIEKNPEVAIIDVRTDREFNAELGHIPGAQLKPLQDIENWVSEIDSLKDKEIILVCRSGNRSTVAGDYLYQKGFKNVINVKGGMRAWNAKEYAIEKQ